MKANPTAHWRRVRPLLFCAWAAPLGLAGCGRPVDVVLRQPFAPPTQQQTHLTSETGYYAVADGRQRLLLTFALPGAQAGARAYVVYLTAPEQDGAVAADAARGFFLQEFGALAGRCEIVGGELRVRRPAFQPRVRELRLKLRCDDGTELSGAAQLQESSDELRIFERRYAADVARLDPTSQPADPNAVHRPRPSRKTP